MSVTRSYITAQLLLAALLFAPLNALYANGIFQQSTSSANTLTSSVSQQELPSIEEAFAISASPTEDLNAIKVHFDLYPEVYLYQHRFSFRLRDTNDNTLEDFVDLKLPQGIPKVDAIFGDVIVYFDELTLKLPLNSVPLVDTVLEIRYQGCLENILCYPPQRELIPLSFIGDDSQPAIDTEPTGTSSEKGFVQTLTSQNANDFAQWLQGHDISMTILLFFAGGLLLTFTPCVFPMIPILSGIIAGSNNPSASRGFTLSTAYVLGMAIPYTLAGLLVAIFGAGLNLQYLLQQPAAIISSAVIFAVLSLAMFGLYELQLPEKLRNRLNALGDNQKGGSVPGAMVMGLISALVVSPCVTPILAGALVYVAGSGDAVTGAVSLFSLAMGMGVPLIIFGTGGAHLLPKAGDWMEQIKRLFGVLMLLVAVWLLDRIVQDSITLGLYGIIIAVYGIYLGAFEPLKENQPRIQRAIAIVLALYGAIMLVGASGGGTDPLQPLNSSDEQQGDNIGSTATNWDGQLVTGEWFTVYGESSLQAALDAAKQANKTVLVDFFAEWCVACIVLEEETLTKPNVLEAMADVVLIRADVTEINAENRKIMERFDILGLPCLIFFNADGNEIPNSRILGEMGPDTFLKHLNGL